MKRTISEIYKETIILTIKAIAHYLKTKYKFRGKKLKVIVNKIFHDIFCKIDHTKLSPQEIFREVIPQVEFGDNPVEQKWIYDLVDEPIYENDFKKLEENISVLRKEGIYVPIKSLKDLYEEIDKRKRSFKPYKSEKVIIGEREKIFGIENRRIRTKPIQELKNGYRGEYITKIVDSSVLKLLQGSKLVRVFKHKSVRVNSSSSLSDLDCTRLTNANKQKTSPPEDDPETYASKLLVKTYISNKIYRDYSFNSKFKFKSSEEEDCEIFLGFFEFILDDNGDIKIFELKNEKFVITIASEFIPKPEVKIPLICAKIYAFCVTNMTLHEIEDLASKIERHLVWVISRRFQIPNEWKEEIYNYIPRAEKFHFYPNDPNNYDELKYLGEFCGEVLIAFVDESYKLSTIGVEKVERYLCKFVAESLSFLNPLSKEMFIRETRWLRFVLEKESPDTRIEKLNEVLGKWLDYYRENVGNKPKWIEIINNLDRKREISCESVAKFCFIFIILNVDLFKCDEVWIVHTNDGNHVYLVINNKVIDPLNYKILAEYGYDFYNDELSNKKIKVIKINEVKI